MHGSTLSVPNGIDGREGLLAELAVIDVEGWDGQRAARLLRHVRSHIVCPQVRAAGLRGPMADQAEATGWEAAWETLIQPSLRDAASPWGLLWVAVRRAVQGEMVASAYLSGARAGWRLDRARHAHDRDGSATPPRGAETPVSLSVLLERGWEPATAPPRAATSLGPHLDAVVSALTAAGWEGTAAHSVVEAVAVTATRDGKSSRSAHGWRRLAERLGLPPWQARRVTVLLLGAPGWPGLMERMAAGGTGVLADRGVRAALRSTAVVTWPPPPVAAGRPALHRRSARVLAAS